MKTLLIEQVSNGWIVKPLDYRGAQAGFTQYPPEIAVFRTIEELQKALPELLAEPVVNPVLAVDLEE
jgi:hypothetical protein